MQLFLQQVAIPLEEFGACAEAAAEPDIAKRRRHIFIEVLKAAEAIFAAFKKAIEAIGQFTDLYVNFRAFKISDLRGQGVQLFGGLQITGVV